jgi:hypothetical protein
MFLLTGTFKKAGVPVTLSRKEVSARELGEYLGVSIDAPIEFNYTPGRKKPDKLNGGNKAPAGLKLKTAFSGSFNGSTVDIQYFRGKQNKMINGMLQETFTPNNLDFREGYVDPKEDQDKLVFLALHPYCEDSPIRGVSKAKYWKIKDRKKEAEQELGLYNRISSVREEILHMDSTMLMLRAKGLLLPGGRRIPISTHTSPSEIPVLLIRDLEKYKSDFINVWNAPETNIRGMVQIGIDKGVLKIERSGEMMAASWRNGNEQICRFSPGSDTVAQITSHVLNNFDTTMARLKREIEGVTISAKAAEMEPEILKTLGVNYDEVIETGLIKDVIVLDFDTNVVRFTQNKASGKQDTLCIDINNDEDSPKYWKTQLVDTLMVNKVYLEKLQNRIKQAE